MNRPFSIRVFQASDEPEVVALWTSVFGYTTPHNDPAAAIRQKQRIQPELFFVACAGGAVVGTVMGGYDGHRGWIYSLAVAPGARGHGIGSALVRHVEKELQRQGCPKINLQLHAFNAQTVAFYQKLGFAVEDRISMGKLLEVPQQE